RDRVLDVAVADRDDQRLILRRHLLRLVPIPSAGGGACQYDDQQRIAPTLALAGNEVVLVRARDSGRLLLFHDNSVLDLARQWYRGHSAARTGEQPQAQLSSQK